jgi:DNA-binding transcriptional regulator GbsR (MarR family)
MKLSDFLQGTGRPVAYYPGLRKITGSTNATIFLCQFIYWTGKESAGDGWIYKEATEIETETGLSYNEQKTARRNLKEAGILKEQYKRLDHRMYFKVDLDALNQLWRMLQSDVPECDNVTFGNDEIHHSLNESENTTETTTESTLNNSDFKFIQNKMQEANIGMNTQAAQLISEWLDEHEQVWIIKAITENAGKHQNYIDKILVNWKAKGYPKPRKQRIDEAKKETTNRRRISGL